MDAEFTGKLIEVLLRVALGIGAIFAIMYCVRKSRQRPNWARWHRATSTTDSSSPMPS